MTRTSRLAGCAALLATISVLGCGGGGSTSPFDVHVTGVTLKASTTILVGGTEQLTATISPANATNKGVTWASSDTGVATVSNTGLVTALVTGTTTITVTTNDRGKTATCLVTVTDVVTPVTGVSLDQTTLALNPTQDANLTATVSPANASNQNLTWTTSDTGVATISPTTGGAVTVHAVAVGSATITVTTADGGKTATCLVTVTTAVTPVTGVSLDQTTLSLNPTQDASLAATVSPSNASNQNLTWTTSDTGVATISPTTGNVITVHAVAAGSATITVTTEDGGKTATCLVTVTNAQSSDNNLTGLVLLDASYTLSPAFISSTTDYTANVASVVPNIRVVATLSAPTTATMTIGGNPATSGTATPGIALNSGANEILIDVRAENGDVKHYKVTVTKAAAPVTVNPTWTGAACDVYNGGTGTAPAGSIDSSSQSAVTFTASGGTVNNSNRRFYFISTPVAGDFQFTARLNSVSAVTPPFVTTGTANKYGLLMTENLNTVTAYADSARFAEVGYYMATTTGPTFTASRGYKETSTRTNQSRSDITSPSPFDSGVTPAELQTIYFRLTRLGSRFVTSWSLDPAGTFTQLNSSAFTGNPLPDTWYVGLFAAPSDNLTFGFDSISIVQ